MRRNIIRAALIATFVFGPAVAMAADTQDTLAARQAAANVYFKAYPVREMVEFMVSDVMASVPAAKQKQFHDALMANIPWDRIEPLAETSLAKNLTLPEIDALNHLVARPEGKSALKKMHLYESGMMPAISTELEKAVQKAMKEIRG